MANLLAQRRDIARAEKEAQRRKAGEEEQREREDEGVRRWEVEHFEKVQMGLEGDITAAGRETGKVVMGGDEEQSGSGDARPRKRKFEIDELELERIASAERGRAKRALDMARKASRTHLPSFWVPGETPDTNYNNTQPTKTTPTCPASDPELPHNLSLKTLVVVSFTMEKSVETGLSTPTCPSCRKALSNATKAIIAMPCGHVLCKPCVDKFLKPEHRQYRDAHDGAPEPEGVHCYVCDADLTRLPDGKGKSGKEKEGKKAKKDCDRVKPGLVEIRSEGTGFAGGGKAMVRREGIAFQV